METKSLGFTFIELILVLAIVSVLFALVGFRTGTFTFWKEEGFVRSFSQTARFLFMQASADQVSYQLEIDLKKNAYRVGAVIEDKFLLNSPTGLIGQDTSELGNLSLEIAMILNPTYMVDEDQGNTPVGQSIIAPPSFPSLYEWQYLPTGMVFNSVRTSRQTFLANDDDKSKRAYVFFASGGFSDFASIQVTQSTGEIITFVINPFTRQIDIYRGITDIQFEDLFRMQSPSSPISLDTPR